MTWPQVGHDFVELLRDVFGFVVLVFFLFIFFGGRE